MRNTTLGRNSPKWLRAMQGTRSGLLWEARNAARKGMTLGRGPELAPVKGTGRRVVIKGDGTVRKVRVS